MKIIVITLLKQLFCDSYKMIVNKRIKSSLNFPLKCKTLSKMRRVFHVHKEFISIIMHFLQVGQ